MLADQLGSDDGLAIDAIEAAFPAAQEVQKGLRDLRRLGQLPFQDLPFQEDSAAEIMAAAEGIRERCDHVVVLGIGGSALGPASAYQFLKSPIKPASETTPQLFVIDNVDPLAWQDMESQIDLNKTYFIVISKSGGTVETLASFAYFRNRLIQHLGRDLYHKNVGIVTDPEMGPLREIVQQEKITNFEVPAGVGGRYSVLSPVGLFPAACVGIDIAELLAGARTIDERSQTSDLWTNPPYLAGILAYLMTTQRAKSIRTLMPYSEALESYTEWFAQLWAESLGKKQDLSGQMIHAGSTPVRAMGATDQHSQLQLYLEGPRDKMVTFYTVEEGPDHKIPESYSKYPELEGLAGQAVKELLNIEYRATEQALRKAGVPSLTLQLSHLDANCLGQLFYFAEIETVVAGELFNINPFDQPAVEHIKRYTKALLGLPGFDKELAEIEGNKKKNRYVI